MSEDSVKQMESLFENYKHTVNSSIEKRINDFETVINSGDSLDSSVAYIIIGVLKSLQKEVSLDE